MMCVKCLIKCFFPAIVALKEELVVFRRSVNELKEFIPLKKGCGDDEVSKVKSDIGDKKNWLRSTQLCTNPKQNFEQAVKKQSEEQDVMVKKFIPFKEEIPGSGLSLTSPRIKHPMKGNVYLAKNKYRLHNKRFPAGAALGASWAQSHDHYLQKLSNSQSGSPDGPLLNYTNGGTSTTSGDSIDDCEDERSENNYCKFMITES
nr:transcription factor HHO5-like [Tanacetum cinerariifolium]